MLIVSLLFFLSFIYPLTYFFFVLNDHIIYYEGLFKAHLSGRTLDTANVLAQEISPPFW